MSIRLEMQVVEALADVPLTAVSRLQGELLQHFARHAHLKSGDIYISSRTAARDLRTNVSRARAVIKALIAMGVVAVVKPSTWRARVFRLDVDALRSLRRRSTQGASWEGTLPQAPCPHQGASNSGLGCLKQGLRVPPGEAPKVEGRTKKVHTGDVLTDIPSVPSSFLGGDSGDDGMDGMPERQIPTEEAEEDRLVCENFARFLVREGLPRSEVIVQLRAFPSSARFTGADLEAIAETACRSTIPYRPPTMEP